MKWYFISGAALIIIASALFIMFRTTPKEDSPQPTPGLPVASSTTPGTDGSSQPGTAQISVATRSGGAIAVADFIHNGETVADVVNPGSFVLAGSLGYCLADGSCPTGAPADSFTISYNENTHFFNVVLLTEPIGAARREAEQFFISRLGIVPQQACGLIYSIGAPYWVNTTYDDRNLGFSFCPGATVLPE